MVGRMYTSPPVGVLGRPRRVDCDLVAVRGLSLLSSLLAVEISIAELADALKSIEPRDALRL